MYNFNFIKDEHLIEIFEEIYIKQKENEKITTIVLTDKRLLFLDYITNDSQETLRITKRLNLQKYKEIYYEINLNNIKDIIEEEYYKIILKDNFSFEFNNEKLYKLLLETKKENIWKRN